MGIRLDKCRFVIIVFVLLTAVLSSCGSASDKNGSDSVSSNQTVQGQDENDKPKKGRWMVIRTQIDNQEYDNEYHYEEKNTFDKGKKMMTSIWQKEYTEDGRISKGKKEMYYDENGNITEQNEYNADGAFVQKVVYEYDEKGDVLSAIINYPGTDEPQTGSRWWYQLSQDDYYFPMGTRKIEVMAEQLKSESKYEYKYVISEYSSYPDEEGTIVKSYNEYDDPEDWDFSDPYYGPMLDWYKLKYDSAGKVIERYDYETGLRMNPSTRYINSITKYSYDDKGRLSCEELYNEYDQLWRKTEYSYDKNDNMILKVVYSRSSMYFDLEVEYRQEWEYEFCKLK